MAVVVVGGHTRNIGKTSVVAGLVAALPHMNWTAIKVTQFGHGVCSADGKACGCDTGEHTVAVSEERHASGTDSGRYLASGAVRSLWVRTRQGQLIDAMPRIRKEIAASESTIIESNSILRFLQPDLYLSVLDPTNMDFKDSARRYLDRADAVILPPRVDLRCPVWNGLSPSLYRQIPTLHLRDDFELTPSCVQFVEGRLQLPALGLRTSE